MLCEKLKMGLISWTGIEFLLQNIANNKNVILATLFPGASFFFCVNRVPELEAWDHCVPVSVNLSGIVTTDLVFHEGCYQV